MNNHMSLKLVGANSSLELNSPITSIYLQEELTGLTTLPGIRETKGMNIGMDGGWTSAQFYEPRLITVKGVIANQDVAVVEQRRKQLIQLLAEKRLALEFQTEAGNHYTMNVVVAGVQMPLSKVLTASYFQINLRADDPLIYDNNALAELEAILRRSSSASSGFTINFPINFQLGTSESRPTIDNFGSSVIYPVITLTGPLTTPEIVNITTNMAFTIDEVLGAGTYTASGIRGAMTQEGSVDTYSGNPIQATRDAESPISKFSLYGNATQTTYSGKNLIGVGSEHYPTAAWYNLDVGATITTTTSGATIAETANGFNITLTAAWYGVFFIVPVTAGQTYHIKINASGTGCRSSLYWLDADKKILRKGGVLNTNPLSLEANLTVNSGEAYVALALGSNAATTLTVTEPQLEKGSQASSYEPYVGGTASPNPDYPQDIQVVTGENTVKIMGKNLFDKSNVVVGYVNNSGTISTGGGGDRTTADYIPAQSEAEYTISGSTFLKIAQYDSAQKFIKIDTTTSAKTLMVTTESNTSFIRASAYYGDSVPDVQLEKGTATEFEAYHGQSYEINLGKNLLENTHAKNTTTTNGMSFTVNDDGSITLNGTATALTWFVFHSAQLDLPDGTYTISLQGGTNANIGVYNDKFGNTALGSSTAKTITSASGNVSLRVASGATASNLTVKPMIERGSTATDYAPYFTPIELAKIGNYQDRIYKDDGKWYIHKEIDKTIYDGSNDETWGIANSGTTSWIYYTYLPQNNTTIGVTAMSNLGVWSNLSNGEQGIFPVSNKLLRVRLGEEKTTADWRTFLASTNMIIYYALATPITTEITEQALIDQLDAVLEAHLYEGVNNISNVTIGPNLAGDLEIKTGQTLTVINSLSIVGSSGAAEIGLGGSELAMVGSVADELTINGTTGAVTKTARIGKIESYAGETITTDYISTSGGLDSDATIYYVLPSSSTSVINTLDSTALAAFNGVVASGGVSAQTNIGSISVDVTTVTAQDVAVVDTKQHTVTINGVGAYSKFSGDWLTLDVGLNELQLITENNTDTGSAVIKYRVGYMGV